MQTCWNGQTTFKCDRTTNVSMTGKKIIAKLQEVLSGEQKHN